MASSKPYGVCWCDCHMPVDENGKRKFDDFEPGTVNGWPKYEDPIATVAACDECKHDHAQFVASGIDPFGSVPQ